MRLVLDLQACQSGSRFRGIGRYSWSLALRIMRLAQAEGHDVWVVLNASFPDEAEEIKSALVGHIEAGRVVSFSVPSPCAAQIPGNTWRHRAAELLREHAIARLKPDFVHVSTLLADCWSDDSIASVGELPVSTPTALTHYDLIPLVMEREYLPDGQFRRHYLRKLESVRRASLLLAISEFSRQEAAEILHLDDASVVNISAAVEEDFTADASASQLVIQRYGLKPGFLLYAPGGFDPRKNLNRLIEAYAQLPSVLRQEHQLVIASKLSAGQREAWTWKAGDVGLAPGELVLTDYVPDNDLKGLYSACHSYVFPSLHEGFGLPVLEAMAFGVAVIASNRTSVPEAVGLNEALFDPTSVDDIRTKLERLLVDEEYLSRLRQHALRQTARFSWHKSARTALDAMTQMHKTLLKPHKCAELLSLPDAKAMLRQLGPECDGVAASPSDIQRFIDCYTKNCQVFCP